VEAAAMVPESTWGKIVTRGWRKETVLMREAVLFFCFLFFFGKEEAR